MKSTTIETFDNLCSELCNARQAVRNHCIDMLKEICNRTESKEINLSKMNNFLDDEDLPIPMFCYEGGPECDSTYSYVEGFELNENNIIVFTIEDSDCYETGLVLTDDLVELCEIIIEYENAGYELGVNEYEGDGMDADEYERLTL